MSVIHRHRAARRHEADTGLACRPVSAGASVKGRCSPGSRHIDQATETTNRSRQAVLQCARGNTCAVRRMTERNMQQERSNETPATTQLRVSV